LPEEAAPVEYSIYEHVAFLVSSALRLYEEPVYGQLRLLDAARRFLNFAIACSIVKDESKLKELEALAEKINWAIENLWRDPERLKEFLVELNVELAEKMLK